MVVRWAPLALLLFSFFLTREVIGPFLVGAVMAYLASGPIDKLHQLGKGRVGRPIITILLFALLFLVGGWGISVSARWLAREGESLAREIPSLIDQTLFTAIQWFPALDQSIPRSFAAETWLTDQFRALSPISLASIIGTSTLEALIVLTSSIYLAISGPGLMRGFLHVFPKSNQPRVRLIINDINRILRRYLFAQLFLVGWVALMMWLGLHFIFNIRYAAALSLATGLLELIPFVGPIAAASIGVTVAVGTQGADVQYILALIVFYTLVRQVEDQLVMPLVYGHSVEVPPAVSLLSVIAGGHLGGPLGMVLAMPVVASGLVVMRHLIEIRDRQDLAVATQAAKTRLATARPAALRPRRRRRRVFDSNQPPPDGCAA